MDMNFEELLKEMNTDTVSGEANSAWVGDHMVGSAIQSLATMVADDPSLVVNPLEMGVKMFLVGVVGYRRVCQGVGLDTSVVDAFFEQMEIVLEQEK